LKKNRPFVPRKKTVASRFPLDAPLALNDEDKWAGRARTFTSAQLCILKMENCARKNLSRRKIFQNQPQQLVHTTCALPILFVNKQF
jgi:hypothetical protein